MKNATATLQPLEVIKEEGGITVTALGTLNMGRSKYHVEQVDVEPSSHYGAQQWLQLRGPRGTTYQLQEDFNQTGTYTPVSLGSGPMVRNGNRVKVIMLGNIIEMKF